MKLIIDIPDYEYRQIKEVYEKNDIVENTYSYIYHGTPLDDVKAEIDQYLFQNEFGLEYRKEVLQILDNIGKTESEDE